MDPTQLHGLGCERGNIQGAARAETTALTVKASLAFKTFNARCEPIIIGLLTGHGIKLPSKYISLCTQINVALKPHQRSIFAQRMDS